MPTRKKDMLESYNKWKSRDPPTFLVREVTDPTLIHDATENESGDLANAYGEPENLMLETEDELCNTMITLGHELAANVGEPEPHDVGESEPQETPTMQTNDVVTTMLELGHKEVDEYEAFTNVDDALNTHPNVIDAMLQLGKSS